MSSEQPAVTDITQQATSPTPKQHAKNPKRVAAGKAVAERTRKAREEQKKAAAKASVIIANNKAKAAAADPETDPPKNIGLTLNQWIGIGGFAVSAAGLYLKREEIMASFKKNLPEPPPPPVEPPPPVDPPPTVEPAPKRKGIRKMD